MLIFLSYYIFKINVMVINSKIIIFFLISVDWMTKTDDIVSILKKEEKEGIFFEKQHTNNSRQVLSEDTTFQEEHNFPQNQAMLNKIKFHEINDDLKKKLLLIVDTTSDFICFTKFSLHVPYTFVNHSYKDILGYEPDEMLGKSAWDFVHPDDKLTLLPLLKMYLSYKIKKTFSINIHNINENFTMRIIDKKGTWHYFQCTANLLENEILFVSKDITELKRTEEQLQESEQRYQRLFDTAADLIIVLDKYGKIEEVNNRFIEESKYQKDEVISKNIFTSGLVTNKSLLKITTFFSKIIQGKDTPIIEIEGLTKHGEIVPYELRAKPVIRNGTIIGVQAILRNLTERKKTENELVKEKILSESLLKSLPGIFYLFDKNGRFIRWNQNFEKVTEYTPEEIKGISPINLFNDQEKEKIACAIKEVFEKGYSFVEGNFRSKSGKETPYYFTGFKVIIENEPHLVGVGIDLINLKQAENDLKNAHVKLKQLNKDLEQKVKERTQEINRLLKQKDEFINQLGHDLKNPLGPLINLIPVLERNEQNQKNKEILSVINRNVLYMRNLVVKTIKLAQLNSEKMIFHFDTYQLSQLINQIVETNELSSNEKRVEIKIQVPEELTLFCDQIQFEELFHNLINNAVKYSNEGGSIVIKAKDLHNEIIISIQDNGIGMSEDQLYHIFDEFYKADESRHDFESSGLGMSICKRIMEKHNGRIWAESKGIGKGSIFYVAFPNN